MQPHRRQPSRLSRPWDSPGKNTGVGCHFLLQCMKVKSESEVAQLCPTLCDPMDCSPPGSSTHGIFQARVLEWGAISFSDWLAQVLGKSWQLLCWQFSSVQFSCCDPMDCSMPGFTVHYHPPELAQAHVHRVGDAIQQSHHLSSPSPPVFNLSQHQGFFQWVSSSSHQVAKVLELQHQSFQFIFRADFL